MSSPARSFAKFQAMRAPCSRRALGVEFPAIAFRRGRKTRAIFVDLVRGTSARILDTRKTLPGLRLAQKSTPCAWAAATIHRIGLYDGILIRKTTLPRQGGIGALKGRVRAGCSIKRHARLWIEVEVESLKQLKEAVQHGAKLILLDNMDNATMSKPLPSRASTRAWNLKPPAEST